MADSDQAVAPDENIVKDITELCLLADVPEWASEFIRRRTSPELLRQDLVNLRKAELDDRRRQ